MNTFKISLLVVNIFALSHYAWGLSLGDVILRNEEGLFMAASVIDFDSVTKTKTDSASGYDFDHFHINQIQIRKGYPARIFYANKDIMPPCMFSHAAGYPPPEEIIQIKSLKMLSGVLGGASETKEKSLYWSFFKTTGKRIYLIHVRVLQGDGDNIDAMSIYEASANYLTFNF